MKEFDWGLGDAPKKEGGEEEDEADDLYHKMKELSYEGGRGLQNSAVSKASSEVYSSQYKSSMMEEGWEDDYLKNPDLY